LALSLTSVSFGAHLAYLVAPFCPAIRSPNRNVRYGLTCLAVLTYAATYPAYFLLPAAYRHQATAALLFSYPGTLTRYVLSIQLNPIDKLLPLGTYTANVLGTALLGAFRALQSIPVPPSQNACAILQGLEDGYCGCLTTVTTFAAEVAVLKDRKAWFYVLVSWTTGQLFLVAILGSSIWTGHVSERVTCIYL
jgi:CrcB protein